MEKKALVLVDGGVQDRKGLDGSLSGVGYVVDAPVDTWQAIQKVKESSYDLAVIDLDLPPVHGVAVTGWDLGRIFRAYHPAISIVYLSRANSKEPNAVKDRVGVEGWIREPIHNQREGAYAL
jgi:CheY-like chemotaxis protein